MSLALAISMSFTLGLSATPQPDGFELTIEQAYGYVQAAQPDKAEPLYRRATQLQPASEDAWLGLQLSLLQQDKYAAAAAAGDQAIALNPNNFWALSRQALARYVLRDYQVARGLYERALRLRPEDPTMLLGLGFTLARLGEVERGHDLCRQAAEAFPTDPRINECLQTEPPAEVVVGASLSSGYMSYSDPWELVDLLWLTATAGVELASGVGLWAGVTWARTSLNYELDDFVQTHPVLGLYVMKDGFEARLSGTYLFANDGDESAPIDGAWGLSGRVGYGSGDLAGYLDLAASVYSATTAVQLDPRLSWRLSDRVTLTLGPELQVLTAEGEVLGSGHVGADIRLNAILTMRLYGWGGTRRYAVEAGGLSVWTSADRYVGGYRAGLSVEVAAPLHLDFEWRHDFGDQQADEDHDFQLTGGTVNLRATF